MDKCPKCGNSMFCSSTCMAGDDTIRCSCQDPNCGYSWSKKQSEIELERKQNIIDKRNMLVGKLWTNPLLDAKTNDDGYIKLISTKGLHEFLEELIDEIFFGKVDGS